VRRTGETLKRTTTNTHTVQNQTEQNHNIQGQPFEDKRIISSIFGFKPYSTNGEILDMQVFKKRALQFFT
jgi:hypothetical protein